MISRIRRKLPPPPSRAFHNFVYQGHDNYSSRLNPHSIRLLNWNMAKGSRHGSYSDLQRLSVDMDMVLIQEAALEKTLYQALGDKTHWAFSPGYSQKTCQTGVLTVSDAKPVSSHSFRHVEPLLRTPKATLITEYALQDSPKTLLVANIHAVNFTIGTKIFSCQLDAAYQLMRVHDGPILFCGDFNTWQQRRIKSLNNMIRELKLQSVDFLTDRRKHSFGLPLDHILYLGLEPRHAHSLAVTSSDHNPMNVEMRVLDEFL